MQITKYGHSCLLVEENGARILIDPGKWSSGYKDLTDIDAILITHNHGDHLDPEGVKAVLRNNPDASVKGNQDICDELSEVGVNCGVVNDGDEFEVNGISIKAFAVKHEDIYDTIQVPQNTGYLIGGRLFHPGDSMQAPDTGVEILALPACAPWLKGVRQGIEFGKAVKPKIAFPIHDAMLGITGVFYNHYKNNLESEGIEWRVLENAISVDIC